MYVVSQDAELLLTSWADKRGFVIPRNVDGITKKIVKYLQQNVFPTENVELVTERELRYGMARLVKDTKAISSVSLDRVYYSDGLHMDVTRGVNDTKDNTGVIARHGYKPVDEQIQDLLCALRGQREITLVDDVIFSGNLMADLIANLERGGITTHTVVAGIAIEEGINVLRKCGVTVRAVRTFPSVIDEICERDFLPGVPLSGRTVVGNDNVGAPYILPFGRPHEWASIPVSMERNFSKFCLNLTANVFDLISEASNRQVLPTDLERCPIGIDTNDPRSFANILRAMATIL